MQIPPEENDKINDEYLKKQYLKLAKVYHPDAQGTAEKFQQLQEAYSRLKAEQKGYTLTEEELYEMYEKQQKDQQKAKQAEYQRMERETRNMYENDMNAKENFEKWKRQKFSAYDQQQHDEFLKNRYQKTFYKYANTQDQSNQHSQNYQQQQQYKQNDFNASSHFTSEQSSQNKPFSAFNSQPHTQGNNGKMSFEHNSKFLAFMTSRPYRVKMVDYYWEEILQQDQQIFKYLSGIIVVGLAFNISLFYYQRMRREIHKKEKLQDLMDQSVHSANPKRLYVDAQFVSTHGITMEQLMSWYDQPQKYTFSNHLRNRILREKKKDLDLDLQNQYGSK